jgi:hypothetical protein
MTSPDVIAAYLKQLDDASLIERWDRQLFSEEAIPIARAEFARRGLKMPEPKSAVAQSTQAGTSSYILLRIIRALFGFIAAGQLLGLLPVIGWLSNLSATNGGMWVIVVVKVFILLVFGGTFFWLRTLINKLHTKKHGMPHPTLHTRWTL